MRTLRKYGLVHFALQQRALVFIGSITASYNLSELTIQWTAPHKMKHGIYIYLSFRYIYFINMLNVLKGPANYISFWKHKMNHLKLLYDYLNINFWKILLSLFFHFYFIFTFKLPWEWIIALFREVFIWTVLSLFEMRLTSMVRLKVQAESIHKDIHDKG